MRDAHYFEISLHDVPPVVAPHGMLESQAARFDGLGITQASLDNSCKLMHKATAIPIDTLRRSLSGGCLGLRSEVAIQMECLQMECPARVDIDERSLNDRHSGSRLRSL